MDQGIQQLNQNMCNFFTLIVHDTINSSEYAVPVDGGSRIVPANQNTINKEDVGADIFKQNPEYT